MPHIENGQGSEGSGKSSRNVKRKEANATAIGVVDSEEDQVAVAEDQDDREPGRSGGGGDRGGPGQPGAQFIVGVRSDKLVLEFVGKVIFATSAIRRYL